MKQLFEMLADMLRRGENAVLATVVASSGSAPGGLGARMLVGPKGRLVGTVGGGAVEHVAEQKAVAALAAGQNTVEHYTLRHSEVGDIGMVCGGAVNIYFQFVQAGEGAAAFARQAADCFGRDEDAWLLCDISADGGGAMALYTHPGGLVAPEAENSLTRLGTGQLKALFASAVVSREIAGRQVYCEPLVRAGRAVVFGGGHVSQALVPLLSGLGFRTVVFEDRPEFADKALFPTADEIVLGDFSSIAQSLTLTPNDYLIVLTRGHAADLEVQKQVLRSPFVYVGVIGSRAKTKAVGEKLLAAGVTREAIASVHTPIGVDIGAQTPAEIGIAIAAELIAVRAGNERTVPHGH